MPARIRTIREMRRQVFGDDVSPVDRHRRDARLQAFYNSTRWKKLRALKLRIDPLCEHCLKHDRTTAAKHAHHIKKVRTHWNLRFALRNLMSVCGPCHPKLEASSS